MTPWTPRLRAALRLPEKRSVSDWVDASIRLASDSAEPGVYRTDRTPYVREWQDSAGMPWVHQITVVASTQVGKTQAALNILAYAISQDPGPITWVMPTREDASEFGENRVQPMVDASPALRREITGERFDAKKRQIRFKRCRILFRSARVPKELASYPARWLFGDEAGKWPQWTQNEAAPFDLARERTRTFWNHKVVLTSTPTVPDGLITVEFERGDRRRYLVPCPHCGEYQALQWKRIKWPARIDNEDAMRTAKQAWYECAHCEGKIEDRHKQPMLAKGFWCPEAIDHREHMVDGRFVHPNDRAQHRSYHIWAGYSPWLTWWEIVAEWLRSKDSPSTLQNFVNSWLGEPWVEKVEEIKLEVIHACVGGYNRGNVPEAIQVLTAGVDVQKRFLVYTVRGWGMDMENWLLDHARVDNFDQLEAALFAKNWPRSLMIRGLFIDTRYRPADAIEFGRKHPNIVKLSKGVEFDDPRPFSAQRIERHPTTGAAIGVMCWHVNVGIFKDDLARSVLVGGGGGPGSFHVYQEADETYLREMSSEHKILVRNGERERERWVPRAGHRQNHFWDTEVYNRAIASLLRIDTLKSGAAAAATERRRPRSRPQSPDDDHGRRRFWRRTM